MASVNGISEFLSQITLRISQLSVLDFIVALRGVLRLFLLHLEAVLLHNGAQLVPLLARDVHLQFQFKGNGYCGNRWQR